MIEPHPAWSSKVQSNLIMHLPSWDENVEFDYYISEELVHGLSLSLNSLSSKEDLEPLSLNGVADVNVIIAIHLIWLLRPSTPISPSRSKSIMVVVDSDSGTNVALWCSQISTGIRPLSCPKTRIWVPVKYFNAQLKNINVHFGD